MKAVSAKTFYLTAAAFFGTCIVIFFLILYPMLSGKYELIGDWSLISIVLFPVCAVLNCKLQNMVVFDVDEFIKSRIENSGEPLVGKGSDF